MTEKHKAAIRRGLKLQRERRHRSTAMIESWKRRRTEASPQQSAPEVRNINQERIHNHKAIDLVLENQLHKAVITALVRVIDELRQPYNNSKRHDLYLMATNKLNDLEERSLIRWE